MECNIDDVLVHEKDQTEHDQGLEAVLMRLVEAGVTLNLDKCQFSTDRVKFFGHVISSSGIGQILKSCKQLQTYRHLGTYKK